MKLDIKAFAVGLLCLAVVPLSACGKKTEETKRAAGITPESAVAFGSISLTPSIEQQTNLLRFANTFVDDEQDFDGSKDDLGAKFVDELFGGDLDYETDFKSWIGSEAAIAVFTDVPEDSSDSEGVAAIIDVSDEEQAQTSLEAIRDSNSAANLSGIQWELIDGKAVIVDASVEDADDAWVLDNFRGLKSGDGLSLAEVERFRQLDDKVSSDRLAYTYVDVQRLAEEALSGDDSECTFGGADSVSAVVSAVRAEPDALRLQVAAAGAETDLKLSDQLSRLPEGTVGALGLATGTINLEELLTANGLSCDEEGLSLDYESIFGDFEAETGVNVQRDFADWISGDVTFVVGSGTTNVDDTTLPSEFGLVSAASNINNKSSRLDGTIDSVERAARYLAAQTSCYTDFDTYEEVCDDPDTVQLGYSFEQVEIAGASNAYQLVFDSGDDLGDIAPVFAVSDERFVVASTKEYAELLLSDGDQSQVAEIGGALLNAEGNVTFAGVVDLDQLADLIEETTSSSEYGDFLDGLRKFNTFEFSSVTNGTISVFDGKLSLDE
jgi:hypothetical protein